MSVGRSGGSGADGIGSAGGAGDLLQIKLTDLIFFSIVHAYLLLVLVWLRVTGQIKPETSFLRLLRGRFKKPASGALRVIHPERGFCYLADLDGGPISDLEGFSQLSLLEDGRPLGPAHTLHDEIRERGHGRYCHWGRVMYFSTSDNSDPRTNARTYTYTE